MPKLIDYPRTSYAGAWEVSDVVDDTGGKCALETCARKLNRKVSGSFKAIVGSAVKFGLLTSKRELLTTTTLFRRIKHAYDKQEELLFHREAFLTPPLFTQLCRKFRSRELPVQMLDIMLIREFDVEEINAQSVAKAFTDGARMVGLLDERNIIADIDQLATQQPPRRELASPELSTNSFRAEVARTNAQGILTRSETDSLFEISPTTTSSSNAQSPPAANNTTANTPPSQTNSTPLRGADAVANLFGLSTDTENQVSIPGTSKERSSATTSPTAFRAETRHSTLITERVSAGPEILLPNKGAAPATQKADSIVPSKIEPEPIPTVAKLPPTSGFRIELSGPGLNTVLDVQDEEDLALARFLLDKIGRQLKK